MVLDEAAVRFQVLGRDAHDRRVQLRHLVGVVPVGAELLRAHRRLVAGVEEQHYALAAVVGQAERSLRPLELEVRRRIARLRSLGHGRGAYAKYPWASCPGPW